jgi:outer membrane protein OmpA-like peptidoglycan-associated protein
MNIIQLKEADFPLKDPLILKSGDSYTLKIDRSNPNEITIIEFQNKFFRTNSAVVLPDMEKPSDSADGKKTTPIATIASCLQYAHNTMKSILITGHTDTAGNDSYNFTLSQKRAQTILATLTGDADTFSSICSKVEYRRNSDYNQILAWVSEKWGWNCHPGQINDNGNDLLVNEFRKEYNKKGPGSTWAPKITEWGGAGGAEIWKAYFNCYEDFFVEELKTDRNGLADIRSKCTFVIDRKWVGCGETHPRTAQNINDYPCDNNRRVEVLFFNPDVKPPVTCENDPAQCSKSECVLYDSKKYPRVILPPSVTPAELGVTWVDADKNATDREFRKATFQGPGIPNGSAVKFSFFCEYNGKQYPLTNTVDSTLSGGKAEAEYNRWFDPLVEISKAALGENDKFPDVTFGCKAECNGSQHTTSKLLTYKDFTEYQLYDAKGTSAVKNAKVTIYSPFGRKRAVTDTNGMVKIDNLPPGGFHIVVTA